MCASNLGDLEFDSIGWYSWEWSRGGCVDATLSKKMLD